ncbi:MAG: tetratricopeptide repeat protein [Bacteroidetes bacterium]|nr:tetratricopeptide repeat protein [Bacteroidota bacterium]
MMRKPLILAAFFLISASGYPCGNSYHRSENAEEYVAGNKLETFRFKRSYNQAALMTDLTRITDEINARLELFENENDQALTYMRMGRYDEALILLQKLEKEKPDEYNVVANLGTLYELTGENEKALSYIKKAVALNAQSHRGSEWVHIKILEAKLLQKDAAWWKTHPVLSISTTSKTPETIINDITYQLKERLPFTPKPDLLTAAVLNETGDYLVQQQKHEQAWIIYKIGDEYDNEKVFGLAEKLQREETYLDKNKIPLPEYEMHFTHNENLIQTGANLLEKGLGMYNRYQEKEREKAQAARREKNMYYGIAGALALLAIILLYFNFRKKKAA